jgi:hypothetical protein
MKNLNLNLMNLLSISRASLLFIILFFNISYSQTWLEYQISNGNQTTIPYFLVSSANSAYINGNQGVLSQNFSSDTGRAFFPLDLVNDPNGYPWRIVVKIGGVTGVLIDPYHVLTAGHIIGFNPSFAYNLISPGFGIGDSPYGYARAEKLYLLSDYLSGNPTDYGIIKLDRPIGALTGWSGYGYDNTDNFFTANIFMNPSYPGAGNFDGQKLYNWKGIFDYVYTDFVFSTRQGIAGMSGSPVFTKVNGTNVTYGVLIYSGIKFNRITAPKYDAINKVLDLNTPAAFDMIPMYVETSPKVLTTGSQLDNLSFAVLNYSKASVSNANITAGVYISQDSLITTADELLGTYTFTGNFTEKSSVLLSQTTGLPVLDKVQGTYWVGVIISGDANTANNTSSGYEAAKIIINNTINYRISGIINSTQSGNGISGVMISGFPNNVKTDYRGYYETEVPAGWSGTVTPSKEGFSFSPFNFTYTNLNQNTSANFTTSKNTFTISGHAVSPNTQQGVWGIKASGLVGEPITNSSGNYSATVYQGYSTTVNLLKMNWEMSSIQFQYSNLNSNKTEQLTAGFAIGGTIYNLNNLPFENVQMNGFPGNNIVKTDVDGFYHGVVDSGWTGTITPSYPGSLFSPVSKSYCNLSYSCLYEGFYEAPKTSVNLKVFLGGAYVEKDSMTSILKRSSKLTQTPNLQYSNKNSVFIYNLKPGDTVSQTFWSQNSKLVDWVVIQILDSVNFTSRDTVLGLLQNDGRILSLQGDTLIQLDVPAGYYFIVIRHRNHLAVMSKHALSLSSYTPLYDFTETEKKYYGHNAADDLKHGNWGMFSGDANYNGIINDIDFDIYKIDSDNGVSGYYVTDFNLDGFVTGLDFNILKPNSKKKVKTNIPTITYP